MASRPPPITTGNLNVQPFNPENLVVTSDRLVTERQPVTITNQPIATQPFNPENLVVTSDRLVTERQPVTITTEPLKTQPFNPDNLFVNALGGEPTLSELRVPPTVDTNTLFVDPVALSPEQQLSVTDLNVPPVDICQLQVEPVTGITAEEFDARLSDGGVFREQRKDWRVKLSLAPESTYIYKDETNALMAPIRRTDGVIFPYTPQLSVQYSANYSGTDLVHSNYKVQQYANSSVDSVNIVSEFTAQDEFEARYVLAVIHFFRTVTKMFYGQDVDPIRGTPPPLCYLYGMGSYQFSAHPLVITNFTLNLPNNVDYFPVLIEQGTSTATVNTIDNRLGSGIRPGGLGPRPNFAPNEDNYPTWVPTKLEINLQCLPIMSRTQVSNNFSVREYANGKLVNGTIIPGGGFW